ncbi:MAG TPA: ATP-binding protein [Candidatus Binatia bacterium]|jgi:heavy metal sensor kinase|nr:ATP-binding protein [Candidatus Binatia bacterium]
MNPHSLKFQLLGWYAGLLLGCFALVGMVTYVALQRSLVNALQENQLRRARQIAQLLHDETQHQSEARVGEEVELRYAPGLNARFVRITRRDGLLVYLSAAPKDQSFDPASLPPPVWPSMTESSRTAPLLGGRKMLLTAHWLQAPAGASYLIETGAPMDELQADLRKWLLFLVVMLPVVAAIALGGGYLLVKRALSPVDEIAASAERITSHNLGERLPIAQTGDELQRLSTALNHMIERLEAAFQHSRRFMADASHELRTPLTVLRGELEGLVQESAMAPEWRERLGSALEEVERLTNIVEGLFAISRLDAGEAAAEWVAFDLGQLASATADQMGLLAEDKKIRLTSVGSMGVWVEGDRARLKQVVVNLLDNAIKYTSEGGVISLTVKAENSKAVLEVADNGIGIPPAALQRVFERFFRVDKARSRDQGGAGLGLSIVKSICTAHHGRVEATSEPGQGSRFRVELPLVSTQANNHKKNHEH